MSRREIRLTAADSALRVRFQELEERERAKPFDQPDEAREYYLMKRSGPAGGTADIVRQYRLAIDKIDRMSRYETRTGRVLPSLHETRGSGRPAPAFGAGLLSRWESLGPGNIGGRTRALLVHPNKPEIMHAGGVSGGIWKTVDGGESWRPVGDILPNIAVNSLAMDPLKPEVIYAGTGEGYFREVVRGTGLPLRGEGIFKSEDGGETWARLESTAGPDFYWVNSLAISNNDPSRVYAATRTGVWRSSDAGRSWIRTYNAESVTGGCLHLALRKDKSTDYLFASCGTFQQATVYRNTVAESNGAWIPVLSETGMGRTSIAIAPSNQDIIYALSTSYLPGPNGRFNGGLHAVFRSDQGGDPGTWRATVRNTDGNKLNTLLLTNPLVASSQICGLGGADSYSTLGWYTNVIGVDPREPEIVWAGGVDLFRSDDGGRNWGPVSHWLESPPSAHADQHVIVFHPGYDGDSNQTMYLGGDGGVWRTDNARAPRSTSLDAPCRSTRSQVRWTSLNHGYAVTQFYHGIPFPDGKAFLGGTQDNGTLLGSEITGVNGWIHILGGDGGYVAVDPEDPRIIYAEAQYLDLYKSIDGAKTFKAATAGIAEPPGNFLFITPFTMDPGNPRRLWTGGRFVWRTGDGASHWERAGAQLSETAKVSAIAVSPSDSDRVLVGMNNGSIYYHDHATTSDPNENWPSSHPRDGFVTGLAFDPVDYSIAYATYAEFGGKHVWKTADGGQNWISIDGESSAGLPDIPVHAVVVDPTRRERLYVATDLGVFVTQQGGNLWAVENTGFANVVTESLSLQLRDGAPPTLWAFTHGRGAWRVPLAGQPIACSPERWIVHVTPSGVPYETKLIATNFSQAAAQIELIPYGERGGPLSPISLMLRPGETRISPSHDLFSGQAVSHFGICGSASVALTAAYRSTAGYSATAHVPETTARATEFLLYPGEWDLIFDGMALVNLGRESSRIEAALFNDTGAEIHRVVLDPALPPNSKLVTPLDYAFRGLRGWVIRIESSQPSAILLLRGSHENLVPALLYQTVPVIPGNDPGSIPQVCNPSRWISHVTPWNSGYATTVLATNPLRSEAAVQLVPFRDDGSRLDSIILKVPAGTTAHYAARELFSGASISHLGICGPDSLRVTSAYRRESSMSASAHVPETPMVDTEFLVYPGEWQVVFDGLAVINRGSRISRVTAILVDSDGNEIRRVTLADNLAPGAKHVALLDGVFSGFQGAALRIVCSEPSSVLLLRGSHGSSGFQALYQTVPIAATPRRQ